MDLRPPERPHPGLAFERLLAVLALGVGVVTLGLVGTLISPTLGLALGLGALVVFVFVVLYEVGRLLADDGQDS